MLFCCSRQLPFERVVFFSAGSLMLSGMQQWLDHAAWPLIGIAQWWINDGDAMMVG